MSTTTKSLSARYTGVRFGVTEKTEGKIKRMYALKTDNFSSKELKKIVEKHIDDKATVTTGLWKGYRPIFLVLLSFLWVKAKQCSKKYGTSVFFYGDIQMKDTALFTQLLGSC